MPTASTAQILGNNESFEPFTSNMYTRRVLAGEFAVVNKYLLQDLIARGLWTSEIRNQIIADKGSVQGVAAIPDDLKALYKTTWEIKQKCVLDMSADRGAFICQSQSLNLHIADPNPGKLTSMHFYAWKKGLKTGMYYLRTRPKADAIAFTVDQAMAAKSRGESALKPVNTEPEECLSCGAFVSRVLCFSFARDVHPADLHAAMACTARRHRATPSPRRRSRYTQAEREAQEGAHHARVGPRGRPRGEHHGRERAARARPGRHARPAEGTHADDRVAVASADGAEEVKFAFVRLSPRRRRGGAVVLSLIHI